MINFTMLFGFLLNFIADKGINMDACVLHADLERLGKNKGLKMLPSSHPAFMRSGLRGASNYA